MMPSRLQAPPGVVFVTATGVEQMVTGAPPPSLRVLSWSPAKNPRDWLSGDQKKPFTPSVPGSWRQAGLAIGLTHSALTPCEVTATASCRPSGEISNAGEGVSVLKAQLWGGATGISCGSSAGGRLR